MAIFESNIIQVSAVTQTAGLIWNVNYTGTTTFGPLGAIPLGSKLRDVTIVNTGANTVFVGTGTGVTAVTGIAVPAGCQLTLQGYNVTTDGSTVTGNFSAICASGLTSTVEVGLATVASVD